MTRLVSAPQISALVYETSHNVQPVLRRIVDLARAEGITVVGLLQKSETRPGRSRCDMVLEDLYRGEAIAISQDRGEAARACRLDVGELLRAMTAARKSLDANPDMLVLNKYGKAEAEGGGMRPLIAEAVERGVPLLIAVPKCNLESWRTFAGDLAVEYNAEGLDATDPGLATGIASAILGGVRFGVPGPGSSNAPGSSSGPMP